jgi:hypothetical protein
MDPFMLLPITCPHCSQMQTVRVRRNTDQSFGTGDPGPQTVGCANSKCTRDFEANVQFEIVEGPFLAAAEGGSGGRADSSLQK